jgi:hypothetical protein
MVPQNKKVKSIRQKVLLHTIYCATNLQLITQDCLKFERNSITGRKVANLSACYDRNFEM